MKRRVTVLLGLLSLYAAGLTGARILSINRRPAERLFRRQAMPTKMPSPTPTPTPPNHSPNVLRLMPTALKPERDEIVVVTLNEETDKLYGTYEETGGHAAELARFQQQIGRLGIRGVGYDTDWFNHVSKEQREQFFQQLHKSRIPVCLAGDSLCEIQESNKEIPSGPFRKPPVSYGHTEADLWFSTIVPQRPIDKEHNWANPKSQASIVDIQLKRKECMALAAQMARAGQRPVINESSHLKKIRLYEFSEENHHKISLQDLLMGRVSWGALQGKFVLVGKDYDSLDAQEDPTGQQHNGVFLHAEALATLLHFSKLPRGSRDSLDWIEVGNPATP